LRFPIDPPITFNGTTVRFYEMAESALKHYTSLQAESYFGYIARTLNGQKRLPESKPDRAGNMRYGLASQTYMQVPLGMALSDFRDTVFHFFPERQTIRFVHGFPIRPEQYENKDQYWKERHE
jgi:hypothetical protein